MSHYMTALAMRQEGLRPAAKIVLYWLADHHNGETGECFPSHKRLAEVCEMTDRSVRNQIEALKEMGLIEVIDRQRPNGSQTSNAYKLILKGESGGKNIPTPMENISTPHVHNFPTHNLGNNNLGNKPIGKKAVQLPENWVPSDTNIKYARERDFTDQEIEHEAEQFRNYHHAKGSTFKSWDAAWRTWLGNARKFAQTSKSRSSGATHSLVSGFSAYANKNG